MSDNAEISNSVVPSLAKALVAIAIDMHNPIKGAQAKGVGYKYVELDELLDVVRPIAARHGVAILQYMCQEDLVTELLHESGESRVFRMPMKMGSLQQGSESQKMGAAITYARKYSLMALFAIHGDADTDGAPAQSKPAIKGASTPVQSELSKINSFKTVDPKAMECLSHSMFDEWIAHRAAIKCTTQEEIRKGVLANLNDAAPAFHAWLNEQDDS